jgi:hypothetical protein
VHSSRFQTRSEHIDAYMGRVFCARDFLLMTVTNFGLYAVSRVI